MFSKKLFAIAPVLSILLLVACQNKSNSGDSPAQRIQAAQDSYNRCVANIDLRILCDSAKPSGNINVMSVEEYSGNGTAGTIASYQYDYYSAGVTNYNANRNYRYFSIYIPSLSDSDLNALISEWDYITKNGISRTESLNPVRGTGYYPGSYPGYYY